MKDIDDFDVVDGQFRIQCGQNGKFPVPADISWPVCTVENCTKLHEEEGYFSETPVPMAVGKKAVYKCNGHPDKVTDVGDSWTLTCGENGKFTPPETWPTCRCVSYISKSTW